MQGNGVNIADGNATPSAADNTLFGTTPVTGGTIARTFTIQNSGTGNLTVSAITFTGANGADFSASAITLPATIAASGSTTFTVTFDPTAAGVRNATVNIANTDSNENPYDFAVQGNGFVSVAPTGTTPPVRWSPAVQNANFGSTRAVGSTTSGDVIAATRITSNSSASDIRITRHVAATGAVAWTRDINNGTSEEVNEMIVDPANGDAYLCLRGTAGANSTDWFVVKVNGADGTTAWTYTHNGTLGTGLDECVDLARTSDGNIVAVGTTVSTGGSTFGRVAKINASTGAQIWAYVNGSAGSQFAAVATDTLGNTYATGYIAAANTNGLTVKLSSAGAQTWAVAFDGTAGLADSFSQIVVDPSGDCVVGGTTRVSATDIDVIVLKYTAVAGAEVWRRTIAGGGAGPDDLQNLVVDASGNFYASGAIRSFITTDLDAFVSKINNTGTSAWITTKFGSASNSSDRYQNVRVVGTDVYAVGDIENTNRDILVSRFNGTTGAEVWSATFNGSGNGLDDVYADKHVMTMLGTDAIAIGGETFDVSGNTFGIVLKYAASLPPTVTNVSKSATEDVAVAFAAADFTGNYTDPNGDPLTIVRITSLPPNGVLKLSNVNVTLNQDIPIANIGNLTYITNLNYNGGDSFGWNGSNGTFFAGSAASVNLTIAAVNDKPTFTAANPPAVNEDAGAQTVTTWATFSAGPANEAGQTVAGYTVSNVSNTSLFSAGPSVASNGNLTYTPAANANGTSTFTVRVQDSGGTAFSGIDTSDPQTFTITVNAVNDNPTAVTDTIVRYPSQPVRVKVSVLLSNDTDVENDTLSLTAVSTALPAGATVTQDGTWVYYSPPVGSTSAGSFTYTISDGHGGTANGLVNVNIIVDNATAQNITKIETLGDGSKRLTFGGIPGRTYRVQSTDNITPATWVDRATVVADAQGKFQFTDPIPLPPTRFYRSVTP